jgi:penicillin G amidase
VPFVIAGHNEHVAWGFTALYADVQDLYVEKLDGKGNYQGRGRHLEAARRGSRSDSRARRQRCASSTCKFTAHGPLLNPIFRQGEAAHRAQVDPLRPNAERAAALRNERGLELDGVLGGAEHLVLATQNVVYSDDQGHIAYHAVGKIPIASGGPLNGRAHSGRAHEWQGYIPFDQMPNAVDPPSGFLATANSRVTTEKSPYPLSLEWADPYRIERIYKCCRAATAHAQRHAGRADRHLQRGGPGTGPSLCLRHRPHPGGTTACARPPT